MIAELNRYLDSVRYNLRLDTSSEREVIDELETHIDDRVNEFRRSGLSEEEAVKTCLRLLGSAKTLARQIYEAHSQGTWRQALLASLPHFLFALMFALNWWRGTAWLLVALALVLVTAICGWWRGKPSWLFPWLGYSLVPVVVAGLLLLYLPRGWSWMAVILYFPFAIWLLCSVMVRTIKRDWLYFSLMLFPVPILIGWFLALGLGEQFPEFSLERLSDFAPWIGLSFLVLGVTAATFIRLRQRWLKVVLLLLLGSLTLAIIAYHAGDHLGWGTLAVLFLGLLSLFLTPVLLDRKVRGGRRPTA
ncbi:MAG: permease prefix domain 1-containing protein [Dehalococcoidales bacterium]|nr:permease prefix domain 1-containing protein [Dehalococcoidales bacterium]